MSECPYCGSHYEPPPLGVDLNNNFIVIDGKRFDVSPRMAEVFMVLLDAHPVGVRKAKIMAKVWGALDVVDDSLVSLYIGQIRDVLEKTKWTVTKLRTTGGTYRLVER